MNGITYAGHLKSRSTWTLIETKVKDSSEISRDCGILSATGRRTNLSLWIVDKATVATVLSLAVVTYCDSFVISLDVEASCRCYSFVIPIWQCGNSTTPELRRTGMHGIVPKIVLFWINSSNWCEWIHPQFAKFCSLVWTGNKLQFVVVHSLPM